MTTDNEHIHYSPGERTILRELRELQQEIKRMGTEEQADFTQLEGTVEGLVEEEHEVATEFSTLAEELKGLQVGQITAAQINELNAKAVALGEKLKADVASA